MLYKSDQSTDIEYMHWIQWDFIIFTKYFLLLVYKTYFNVYISELLRWGQIPNVFDDFLLNKNI